MIRVTMNDKIKLYNRYNEDNYLIKIDNGVYTLHLGNVNDGDHVRIGLLEGHTWEDHEYRFVDPPGGPFISIGSEIAGKVVSRITGKEGGYKIYLKDKEDDN